MSDTGKVERPVGTPRRAKAARLTRFRTPFAFPLALAVLALTVPSWLGNPGDIRQIMLVAVFSLIISGTNLSFGYAGEIQFAQVFMFAVGAYLTMALATHGFDEVLALLVIGAVGAAAIAVLIALPAVRIGGWALAMTSFFLIITLPDLIRILGKYTGGDVGLIGIPSPKIFGHALGPTGLYELVIGTTLVWFVVFRNLILSRYSVMFAVLRESPILASSLGQSVLGLRLVAYGLSAVPAGLAGCLFGYVSLVITPTQFDLSLTIGVLAASVIGGSASVYGAIVGGALLQLGPQTALSFANYEPVAFGAFLTLAAILFRYGIAGLGHDLLRRVRTTLNARSGRVTNSGDVLDEAVPGIGGVSAAKVTADGIHLDRIRLLDALRPRALTVTGISKSFGGVKALSDVTLEARPGKITALIGSNGSGKTTLLNLICGYLRPDDGSATLGDTLVSQLSPHRVAREGVGRTFQTPKIPRGISVLDVVASARYTSHKVSVLSSVLRLPRYWSSRREDAAAATRVLELLGISSHAQDEAVTLSLGLRRLVEVARAVCSGSALVLLDEPASGLSDAEVTRLGTVLQILAQQGLTIVLIEHNFAFVRDISDYAYVLNLGRVISAGTPAEVAADPSVISSYLGEEPVEAEIADGLTASSAAKVGAIDTAGALPSEALLSVRGLHAGYRDLEVLRDVRIELRPGQIALLLGRNGVGKTTLLSAICGMAKVSAGTIVLSGRELRGAAVYKRAGLGLALVQEGKRVFHARTVTENLAMGSRSLHLTKQERRRVSDEVMARFPALIERRHLRAGALSGGQQQMLAIATALASRPTVLLLDEPSAGLSPAIVQELFAQIRQLADEGLAVLLVEQLAVQALKIADHVTVLDRGRVVATGPAELFRDGDQVHKAYFGVEAPVG